MKKSQLIFVILFSILIFIFYKGWIFTSLLLLSLILLLIIVLWAMKDPMSDTPDGFSYRDGDEVDGRKVTEVSPGVFNWETKAEIESHPVRTSSKKDVSKKMDKL